MRRAFPDSGGRRNQPTESSLCLSFEKMKTVFKILKLNVLDLPENSSDLNPTENL